jgi:hypothetical protein
MSTTSNTQRPARKRPTTTEQVVEAPRPAEQPATPQQPAYTPKPKVAVELTANEWTIVLAALQASATEGRNMMREFENGSREREQWRNRSQFVTSVEYRVRQQVQA